MGRSISEEKNGNSNNFNSGCCRLFIEMEKKKEFQRKQFPLDVME